MARKKVKVTRADGVRQSYHVGTDSAPATAPTAPKPPTGKMMSDETGSQRYGSLFNRLIARKDKAALAAQREHLADALARTGVAGFQLGIDELDFPAVLVLTSQEHILTGWSSLDLSLDRKLNLIRARIPYSETVAADTEHLSNEDLQVLIAMYR